MLSKHIKHAYKPSTYESKENSGKFLHFESAVRQYIKVQGLNPEASPAQQQQCRTILEICCIGEALSFIHKLSAATPAHHPFWTYEGLMLALRTHYTHSEEADQARRALDALKMTRGTSTRAYIQKLNTLLDGINNMSVAELL